MKKLWYWIALAATAVLVIAMSVLRHSEARGQDALTSFALTVFLTGLTLGPSVINVGVVRRIAPVEELARRRRLLRRLIRGDQRKCAAAANRIEQRALHCAWWDQMSAMIRAAYTLAFREAGGNVPTQVTTQQVTAEKRAAPRSRTISDEFAAFEATVRRETRKPTDVPNPYRTN